MPTEVLIIGAVFAVVCLPIVALLVMSARRKPMTDAEIRETAARLKLAAQRKQHVVAEERRRARRESDQRLYDRTMRRGPNK